MPSGLIVFMAYAAIVVCRFDAEYSQPGMHCIQQEWGLIEYVYIVG